ncbi:translation initiation factor IF-2 [Striga asiatica]|uniref:Translation initiation factor IF-2 n=1 Tax=Striga asiatica TaxID=4170 RepID=A0A5A7PSL8_STRAF|nr:translation initiation factor IF-2 [Striga asiatica]
MEHSSPVMSTQGSLDKSRSAAATTPENRSSNSDNRDPAMGRGTHFPATQLGLPGRTTPAAILSTLTDNLQLSAQPLPFGQMVGFDVMSCKMDPLQLDPTLGNSNPLGQVCLGPNKTHASILSQPSPHVINFGSLPQPTSQLKSQPTTLQPIPLPSQSQPNPDTSHDHPANPQPLPKKGTNQQVTSSDCNLLPGPDHLLAGAGAGEGLTTGISENNGNPPGNVRKSTPSAGILGPRPLSPSLTNQHAGIAIPAAGESEPDIFSSSGEAVEVEGNNGLTVRSGLNRRWRWRCRLQIMMVNRSF